MTTPTGGSAEDAARRAVAALRDARHEDAARTVEEAVAQAAEPAPLRVVLAGEVGQGKSTLANAIVGHPGLLTGSAMDRTWLNVELRHGDPSAMATLADGTGVPIEVGAVAGWAAGATAEAVELVVTVPCDLLETMVIVDTPGVGQDGAASELALGQARCADVLVLVTDCHRGLTTTELEFVRRARERVAAVVVALTKIDEVPEWRAVEEENRRKLQEHAPELAEVRMFPVSAALAEESYDPATGSEAFRLEDREESGVPRLVAHLAADLLPRRDNLRLAKALAAAQAALATAEILDQHRLAGTATETEAAAAVRTFAEQIRELQRTRQLLPGRLRDEIATIRRRVEQEVDERIRQLVFALDDSIESRDRTALAELPSEVAQHVAGAASEAWELAAEAAAEIAREIATQIDREAGLDQWTVPEIAGFGDVERVPPPRIRGFEPLAALGGMSLGHAATGLPLAVMGASVIATAGIGLVAGGAFCWIVGRSRTTDTNRRAMAAWLQRELSEGGRSINRGLGTQLEELRTAMLEQIGALADQRITEVHGLLQTANAAQEADRTSLDAIRAEIRNSLRRLAAARAVVDLHLPQLLGVRVRTGT